MITKNLKTFFKKLSSKNILEEKSEEDTKISEETPKPQLEEKSDDLSKKLPKKIKKKKVSFSSDLNIDTSIHPEIQHPYSPSQLSQYPSPYSPSQLSQYTHPYSPHYLQPYPHPYSPTYPYSPTHPYSPQLNQYSQPYLLPQTSHQYSQQTTHNTEKFITINCPYCQELIEIYNVNELFYRHGYYKSSGDPIPVDLHDRVCETYVKSKIIYGCGKLFMLIVDYDMYGNLFHYHTEIIK